ncbi:MAG: Hsp20/alpha crystallin family protein [Anaeroplasma sp.]
MLYIKNNDKKRNVSVLDTFNSLFNDAFSKEMKTNIEETDNEYIVTSELPGINKDSISIHVDNGNLVIEVNQETNKDEEKNKSYIVKERTALSIRRSFYLDLIDENNIRAKFDNGILTIKVAKVTQTIDPKKTISIE